MDSSWKESLEWIKLHASQAANAMSNDLTGVSVSPRADRRRSRFSQGTMRLLGTALHALQDSFAPAHTERGSAQTSGDPGPIVWIHVYDDANQTRHNEMDLEWNGHRSGPRSQSDPTADFSFNAVCATNASMELIKLVIQSALEPGVRAGNVSLDSSQWRSFAGRWLNLGRPSKPDWIKTAEKTIEKGRADLRRDAEERIKALQKGGGYRPW
jgi:hypothetical protein